MEMTNDLGNNRYGNSNSIYSVLLHCKYYINVGETNRKIQSKEKKMMLEFLGLIGIAIGLSIACVGGIVFGVWVVNTLTDGELKRIFYK